MHQTSSRAWWALGALNFSILAVTLDATVLSVALPTLAEALHASESDLQWFSAGYLLILAAAVLPVGFLGDRFGRKSMLVCSLALFGLGSAACAFAPSANVFTIARVVLGFAGAGITVMAMSALTYLFNAEERPKAVGLYEAANFVGLPLGPILGGWMLAHFWWGWIFLINVPLVLIALVIVIFLVPESRASQIPHVDAGGIGFSTIGMVAITYGLIRAGNHGWTNFGAVACMAVGLAMLGIFWQWERRHTGRPGSQALLDLSLFRVRSFSWGSLLSAVPGLAMIGLLFTMPQYFEGVADRTTFDAGLWLLPLVAGLICGAIPANQLTRAIGDNVATACGYGVAAIGFIMGGMTRLGTDLSFSGVWMAVVGVGVGLAMATATSAALSRLSGDGIGVGTSIVQLLQKAAGPFGTAVMGSVLNGTYRAHLDLAQLVPSVTYAVRASLFAGVAVARRLGSHALMVSIRTAFVHGMDTSLWVSAGMTLVGGVLALTLLPNAAAVSETTTRRHDS